MLSAPLIGACPVARSGSPKATTLSIARAIICAAVVARTVSSWITGPMPLLDFAIARSSAVEYAYSAP